MPRILGRGEMNPHLVCIGGEDHRLRIPFLLSLRERSFGLTAISSDDRTAFSRHGIPHHRIEFDRFAIGGTLLSALRAVRGLMGEITREFRSEFPTSRNGCSVANFLIGNRSLPETVE